MCQVAALQLGAGAAGMPETIGIASMLDRHACMPICTLMYMCERAAGPCKAGGAHLQLLGGCSVHQMLDAGAILQGMMGRGWQLPRWG